MKIEKNTIIYCLGDSLTEGDYGVFGKSGIANVQKENYPYFLSQILGVKTVNFGKCGCTATSYLRVIREHKFDFSSANIFIIMLGTNGGLSLKEQTQGNEDYTEIINFCKQQSPNAKIVLCTPPHATEDKNKSNFGYAPQVLDATLFIRKYCANNNYPLIDCALCDSFTAENEDIMQPNDGLHFSKKGYEILATYISDNLKIM